MASTAAPKTYKVGIICGSMRTPRAGPQITDFIQRTITTRLSSSSSTSVPTFTWDYIDIAALNLPFCDEPGIPMLIKDVSGYTHEHTRAWSRRIAACDAFVFVTPQYNWGIPAGLKNAIDYLFNEWKGKPAMVVSYGSHGGDKAGQMLMLVLEGLRMQRPGKAVNLAFPSREYGMLAATGKDMTLDHEGDETWQKEKGDIVAVWDEMIALL